MLSWFVAGAALLGAPALKDAPKGGSDIQGAWRMGGFTRGGKEGPASDPPIIHTFHSDGSLTYQLGPTGSPKQYGSYKANPKGRPMTIEIVVDIVEQGGPGTLKGIYKVEGDVLTMCWSPKVRPTDFTPPTDPSVTLGVFTRARPKD